MICFCKYIKVKLKTLNFQDRQVGAQAEAVRGRKAKAKEEKTGKNGHDRGGSEGMGKRAIFEINHFLQQINHST